MYTRNRPSIIILTITALLCGIVVGAIAASHHVNNFDNWELRLKDPAWCKVFLMATKYEFEANSQQYPYLVRHGWNVPPYGLNRFYVEQLGVLADASLIFPNPAKFDAMYPEKDYGPLINRVKKFAYEWNESIRQPLPYYTNINGGINTPWDSIEAHRGLLEMPVALSNIVGYGFDVNDKIVINELPDGALVSTYVHPADDLRELEETIDYIEENYSIVFISARDYLELYLSYFPRPVMIDFNTSQAFWAYLGNDTVYAIAVCDAIEIDGLSVRVETKTPPPYFILSGYGFNIEEIISDYELVTSIGADEHVYRRKR